MKLHYAFCTGIILCALASITTSTPCSADTVSQPQATPIEVTAPATTGQLVAVQPAVIAVPPQAQLAPVEPPTVLHLTGHVKQHRHPFLSLMKQEFDSPIHTISTNSKNF